MSVFGNLSRVLGGRALPATIYTFVALLYFAFEAMGGDVMLIRMMYVLYYLLSIYYIIIVHVEGHLPRYIRALDAFLVLIVFYVVWDIVLKGVKPLGTWGNLDFLWWHFKAVAPIFSFYYFGKKNMIDRAWFKYIIVFCFIVVYLSFQHNQEILLARDIWNNTEFTNNVGYAVVSLLPMTFFFKNKKTFQYICIGFITIFTVLSFKRGAILCLGVALLMFIKNEFLSSRRISTSKRTVTIILIIVGFALLYTFIMRLFDSSDYFLYRYEQTISGDSSFRNEIYSSYFEAFIHGEFINIIFGHGVLATRMMKFGVEAHNDWLEYAIDTGLIGILFYFLYWKSLFKEYFMTKRNSSSDVSLAIGVIVAIYFIRTFISMSFYDMPFYSSIVLGYCIAKCNNRTLSFKK